MRILLITGMPGAGKEEFLTTAESMKIPFLRMGDLVRNTYPEICGISIGQFAENERRTHGKDIWARRALEKMSGRIFLVDGCRSMDEVRTFRELSDDVMIVAVHSPPGQRYARLVKRGRSDAPRNIDEFDARDEREMSWGIAEVIALSDAMIVNDSDLETFRERSEKILRSMI